MSRLPPQIAVLLLLIVLVPVTIEAQVPEVVLPAIPTAAPPYTSPVVLPPTAAVLTLDTTMASPPPDRWKLQLDLGFTGTTGNQDLVVLTSGAKLTHLQTEQFELVLSGQTRYGRSRGEEVARNMKGGIQFDLQPEDILSPFLFATIEQDPFQKLDVRLNGGSGVKYTITETSAGNASFSMAGLYSYENLEIETLQTDAGGQLPASSRYDARWSLRFKGQRKLNETVTLDQTTFYQPVWNHMEDYLLDAQTSLDVRMTRSMALRLSHSFERNSTPAPEVQKDDHMVQVGLTIEI